MNSLLASLARHAATWIAGLSALILALPFMLPEDQVEVVKHVDAIAAGVVGLLTVIGVRALPWLVANGGKFLKGFLGGNNGSSKLLLMMATAGGLFLGLVSLSSCSFLEGYDFKGQAVYRFGDGGAKAGVTFSPGTPAKGFVRYPLLDKETGEVTGWVDVEAGRKVEGTK